LGVEVGTERVVIDRNRMTGGGVTAGIDFGLTIAAKLWGDESAKIAQLMLEYDPAPPFDTGSPEKAGPELVKKALLNIQHLLVN
jgi:cyclohexyl-isocyanide hydratase